MRKEPVVSVKKNEELTAALPQPCVSSAGEADVLLVDVTHCGIPPGYFGSVVR
jgi:hypothetical protein